MKPPTARLEEETTASSLAAIAAPEHAGGKMVMELVGAFNELTERMNVLSTSSSRLLFKSLKISILILQSLALSLDGRPPLSKALSVALVLADLWMDAEVIPAGILRGILEAGTISYDVSFALTFLSAEASVTKWENCFH